MNVKKKNIIIIILIIIALILPKFLINPINKGNVKKEYTRDVNESCSNWLNKSKVKFEAIKNTLKENNIPFEFKEEKNLISLVSNEINEPLKNLKVGLFFQTGLKDGKFENEKSELGKIEFTLQKDEKFNINNTQLLNNLMNHICQQKDYDYSNLDKELNEAEYNIKTINEYTTINRNIGEYKVEIQIYKDEKNNIHFECYSRKASTTL